jgi:DNA-binding transcriptional MerR regulator
VGLAVEKGPDAFRTISEVAEDLDLPQHVLRFWETRFAQIKPLKRGGGRRYYRPEDIELLRGIRQLLYGDGYTIRGVQQILREQGVRHVQAIGRAAEAEPARSAVAPGATPPEPARTSRSSEGGIGLIDLLPSLRSPRPTPELPRVVEVPLPQRPSPATSSEEDDMPPFPFRRPVPAPAPESVVRAPVRPVFEDEDTVPRPPAMARAAEPRPTIDAGKLSPEAVRLLKATLFELGECRRLLDASRDERS